MKMSIVLLTSIVKIKRRKNGKIQKRYDNRKSG